MAFKPSNVSKSMAAVLFTIVAMAAFSSAATGLGQSPESDAVVNQCLERMSPRCAMYTTAEMFHHGSLKQSGCCQEIYHMGRMCLNIVTKHVINSLLPKLEDVQKRDLMEKNTILWYLCVPAV
ncbi:unnamed protein product [Microthlaspi erraticum]|uniref:Prolamin-like domain-containing protein n=1 Tax=Microthlaspi erraticum TaxID=1685480 RepID=A0A6D2L7T0_9BRAS|nr:unnamed protein product [Microthlaspi erraticum]